MQEDGLKHRFHRQIEANADLVVRKRSNMLNTGSFVELDTKVVAKGILIVVESHCVNGELPSLNNQWIRELLATSDVSLL